MLKQTMILTTVMHANCKSVGPLLEVLLQTEEMLLQEEPGTGGRGRLRLCRPDMTHVRREGPAVAESGRVVVERGPGGDSLAAETRIRVEMGMGLRD